MINNIFKIFTLFWASLIVACSSVQTNELTDVESAALKDKSLVYTQYDEMPDFFAQTAVNVQFGLLGAAMAASSGNEMIADNGVKDPAIEIAQELAKGLQQTYNVKVIENELTSESAEISDLTQIYQDFDYILDVRTIGWGFIYFVSDWDNYLLRYSTHARLIDRKAGAVVAEETCTATPTYEDPDNAPSYADFETGDALKLELSKTSEACVEHIRKMAKLHYQHKPLITASSEE